MASSPASLTVKNGGGAPLANVGFQITGLAAGSFSTGTTNCGAHLDAGDSCTVQVIFTPASAGGSAATLTISSSTTGANPVTVSLSGTGQSAAGLNVSPTQLSFAAQDLNQPSAAQSVTVSNTGDTTLSGLSLSASGPFSLSQNNCGASLAAGANCATGVVFIPRSRGALSGVLTVTASNANIPATVSLSGIGGLTGAVQITPSLVSFPLTGVGSTSSPITVTIANSSAAGELDDLKLVASSGFKVGNSTCGEALKLGASCTADIFFAPTATGAQSGVLTLTSDQLAATATVPLSGTGFDFQVTTTGSASQSVSSGQAASYVLSIANASGSSATFSFQCGSLPAYAACIFSPSSATVAGNTTGSVSVKISTSQTSSSARTVGIASLHPVAPLVALVLWPLVRRCRRRFLLPLVALAITLAGGLSACSSSGGGGGGGSPPPPVTHTTAAGTYSIPVAISSTGVQHTVTLTLVVD